MSKSPMSKSYSVTKVRVAFECPRLFYLGHKFGGSMMFLPRGNPVSVGTQFHALADRFNFVIRHDPRFQALFEAEPDLQKVDEISAQMQQLLYEIEFFPYLQKIIQTSPEKAETLYQIWQGMRGLIQRWAKLLIQNRDHCSASEVIDKTLLDLKPSVKHEFQLPNGNKQLVQGRFDSLIYDFQNHSLCVVEYKTFSSQDKSAQLAQVALYSYMLKEKIGVSIDSAVYSVLPDWQELTFSWDELEKTVHQLIPHKLQQMQAWIAWEVGQPDPPPVTAQPDLFCDICPQKRKCQAYFTSESAPTSSEIPIAKIPTSIASAIPVNRSIENPQAQSIAQLSPNSQADLMGEKLVKTLRSFGIMVDYQGAAIAPAFIRVKLRPHEGIRVSAILRSSNDLRVQLGLAYPPLIAPQAGYVSVDLPRPDRQIASFDRYIQRLESQRHASLKIAIGVNLEGQLVEADLSDPNTCHFLVGGTTGSGKSEFLRSLLLSLIHRHSPEQLKIVLVDPKRVTFPEFEQMPWLYAPVVKDDRHSIEIMTNLVNEMDRRYQQFEKSRCADISTYNAKANQPLPRIVCIFDEYADFMTEKDIRNALEQSIKRLGAMARAAGIHLIIATQRPEAKVVTPIIRSNLPGRVALRTASEADSAIILGNKQTAAANLLGKGDLLFQASSELSRLQSLFASSIDLG